MTESEVEELSITIYNVCHIESQHKQDKVNTIRVLIRELVRRIRRSED
jgi:hypothetical protein